MPTWRSMPCWALVLLLALVPSLARAHPALEEGMRLAQELELHAALQAFDRALASGELNHDEVVTALTERALLQHALRDQVALVDTFKWLAVVAPDHVLGVRAPPDLVAIWTSIRDQTRGRLSVDVEHEAEPGRLRAELVLQGARPDGIETRLGVRVGDEGWHELEQPVFERELPQGAEVDLYARVVGLGLELASDGSPDDPVHVSVPPLSSAGPSSAALEPQATPDAGRTDGETRTRRRRALWVGVAAAVVTGAVLTGALVATRDTAPRTEVTPQVTF